MPEAIPLKLIVDISQHPFTKLKLYPCFTSAKSMTKPLVRNA